MTMPHSDQGRKLNEGGGQGEGGGYCFVVSFCFLGSLFPGSVFFSASCGVRSSVGLHWSDTRAKMDLNGSV